ncbi:DUF4982 domain-containing protein [Anaerocolumna jejuensis]|uniref:DUF4982 domain-containing protein n=1 Tax=Anaerocolumna jejuensis TaxID=259063 RepID=UPI003F7B5D66
MFRSYHYLPGEGIEARCYTNSDSVELFLNNRSLGRKAYDDSLGYISFIFPFEPGELKAVGYEKEGGQQNNVTDALSTSGAPCGLRLECFSPCEESLSFNKEFIKAILQNDGLLLKQIEITVTDEKGYPCLTDSTLLSVSIEGGTLLGLENGDLADTTEYASPARRAYYGRLLAYASAAPEEKTVLTVSGSGLKERSITL